VNLSPEESPVTPGDEESLFRAFVHGRSQALARSAYLLTGDHGAAEDLLQSALASTWLHWSRIRDKTLVEGYVRRSMINTLTSWRRRRSYGEVPVAAPHDGSIGDASAAADDRLVIVAALRRLPPRQRAAVVLRYYDDLTESETAQALGCSVGTVKSQVARALRTMRSLLSETSERSPL